MLFYVLWATLYRGFFLVCHMLWVVLASFLFLLVHLNLANPFHQLLLGMLHRLQHLNKKVGIVAGIRCCCCNLAPSPLTPSAWLGWCWWSVAGLDFACEGTILMFHICLWSRRHNMRGIYLLSLSFSQLTSEVTHLNVVGLFCVLG